MRRVPILLLLLGQAALAQAPDARKATVAYLQKLQRADGGFRPANGQDHSSLGATSAALRALKYLDGAVTDRKACRRFVASCYHQELGGFADVPGGQPTVTLTAVGIMGARALDMPLEPYEAGVLRFLGKNVSSFEEIRIAAAGLESLGKLPPEAASWRDRLAKMRNADGTWGKGDGQARDTGGAAVAYLRLGGKLNEPRPILEALRQGQREDGGFGKPGGPGSDLETTYRVLRAFHMLKAGPPEPARIRAFLLRCRNSDGGYGIVPGQPSSALGTYFAVTVLHWLGQ